MKARLTIAIMLAALVLYGHDRVKAQTGQIVFLGATTGTTLAANCPAAPTTPSMCVAGDGVWQWQSATTGWYKSAAAVATAGVTGIIVCNAAGTSCTAAQTNTVRLKIPKTATTTVTVGAPPATAAKTVN